MKYGELHIEHEVELECNWRESIMLESSFMGEEYDKADFDSDLFWLFVHNQHEYNEYQIQYNLPQYTLPSNKKCYIISFGRKIKSFYILPLIMNRKDYIFFERYFKYCDNLKEPYYRGIAKYELDYYNDNKVNIYSTDRIELINLSTYVTTYNIE